MTPNIIEQKLRPYFNGEDALAVAVTLINAISATEQVLLGDRGRDTAVSVGRMLTDFAFGLYGNPFWRQHAGHLAPVFATAVMARLDSYEHAGSRQRDALENLAHLSSRQAVAEVLVQVLFCEQGTRGVASSSRSLRAEVIRSFGGLDDNRS